MGVILKETQKRGIVKMLSNLEQEKGFLCADEMGLGKTIMTCAGLAVWLHRHPGTKMVVLAPLSTLPHWKREFDAVDFRGLSCIVHSSNKEEQPLLHKIDVVITTYEGFVGAPLAHDNFDLIVIDEASKIKNKSTKFTKLMIALAKKVKFRVALSATPLENSPMELYWLMQFVQPGWGGLPRSFKTSYSMYLRKGVREQASPNEKRCALAAARELNRKLKPYMIRRLKPASKQQDVVVEVEMTEHQSQVYRRVLATHKRVFKRVRKIRGADGMVHHESYHNKESQMIALKQQAELISVLNGRHTLMANVSTGKMEYVREHLKAATEHDKIAIFFKQKVLLEQTREVLLQEGIEYVVITGSVSGDKRQEAIDSMNAGTARVMLGTSRACGYGINLTDVTSIWILEPDWNVQIDEQTAARADRPGNNHEAITVQRIVTKDTIETAIDNTASDKLVLARLVLGDQRRSRPGEAQDAVKRVSEQTKRTHGISSYNERAAKRHMQY